MRANLEKLSFEERIVIVVREADRPLTVNVISSATGINCQYTASQLSIGLEKEGRLERTGEFYSPGENHGN